MDSGLLTNSVIFLKSGREYSKSFLDYNAQVGIEVESISNGDVSVFLPGSPNFFSGTVLIMKAERVKQLGIPLSGVIKLITQFGKNSDSILSESKLFAKGQ